MSHRYRTGSHLKDGTIVVRPAQTQVLANGSSQIVDRGLRIKYRNGVIDLDQLRTKYNWSDEDFAQAVAQMEKEVTKPRRRGRGFYKDNPVSSVARAAAEADTVVYCAAFWPSADGSTTETCGEPAVDGTLHCAKHTATKEGAAVKAASSTKKKAAAST